MPNDDPGDENVDLRIAVYMTTPLSKEYLSFWRRSWPSATQR